ncbi:MAG: MBL fold metallo-hydrolase, partial [Deferrisomatales bacterium]
IGAYEPRWFMHYAHTDPAEALRAFRDLGAELLVPIQWGVLDLGDEPAAWPLVTLEEALAAEPDRRDRVRVLPVGGRLELDPGAAAGPGR